jgi:chitodextrinase
MPSLAHLLAKRFARTLVPAAVLLVSLVSAPAAMADCGITPQGFGILAGCPPTAQFQATPNTAPPGSTINFDGSSSQPGEPGTSIVSYSWDFGDGTSGSGATTSHVYPNRGRYTVTLTVVDDQTPSQQDQTSGTVTIGSAPSATMSVTPSTINSGDSTHLDASGSQPDPGGTITRYDWDLDGNGDYETAGGTSPTLDHVYPNAGDFQVGVRVTNDLGLIATASDFLHVAQSPDPGAGGGTGGDTGGTGGTGGDTGGTGGTGGDTGGATGGTGGTAGGGTGGTAGGGTGGTTGSAGTTFSASLSGTVIQRVRSVSRRGLALRFRANRSATCTVSVQLSARTARRLGLVRRAKRPVRIGTARVRVRNSGSVRVALKLTPRARKALRRVRSLRLVVRGSAVGPNGKRVRLARVVLLRR